MVIEIESDGGDIYALKAILSIMDAARKHGLDFVTITNGKAMSAGAFVLAYGSSGLRFAGKQATIMIHSVSASFGDGKLAEHQATVANIAKEQVTIFELIGEHVKGKKGKNWLEKEISKKQDKDWFLTAQEALEAGIVNYVGTPFFENVFEGTINIKA